MPHISLARMAESVQQHPCSSSRILEWHRHMHRVGLVMVSRIYPFVETKIIYLEASLKQQNFFFNFLNFYLFMIVTEREREAERDTGRGRSRLHAPGARCGTRSRVSRIAPWAKGRRQTAAPPRNPHILNLFF